jgi:hypothetical protein
VQNRPDPKRPDSVLDRLSEGFFFGASHPVFNSNAVLDKSEKLSNLVRAGLFQYHVSRCG